jgi:hypothetical protein
MAGAPSDKDQEKGDEVLRRLLKTPPDPKKEKRPDRSGTPRSKEDSENSRDAK